MKVNGTAGGGEIGFFATAEADGLSPVTISQGDEWLNLREKLKPRIDADDYDGGVAEVED